jgi:hypothetical protein
VLPWTGGDAACSSLCIQLALFSLRHYGRLIRVLLWKHFLSLLQGRFILSGSRERLFVWRPPTPSAGTDVSFPGFRILVPPSVEGYRFLHQFKNAFSLWYIPYVYGVNQNTSRGGFIGLLLYESRGSTFERGSRHALHLPP